MMLAIPTQIIWGIDCQKYGKTSENKELVDIIMRHYIHEICWSFLIILPVV